VLGDAQQAIDQRRQIPQVCFQMRFHTMIQLLGMKQLGDPTDSYGLVLLLLFLLAWRIWSGGSRARRARFLAPLFA
jgi:hypothetical protein